MINSATAVFENVRRFRTIASLYRQTASFRPHQRLSLLDQAAIWDHRAMVELETYFEAQGEDIAQAQIYAQPEWRAAA